MRTLWLKLKILAGNTVLLWALLSSATFIGYVALRLSPSSYSIGLRHLGIEPKHLYLFSPKHIRSDEWSVISPLHQIAVRNKFNVINETSPYKESLLNSYILPIKHAATFFRPQVWGFFFLPPDFAYSLEYALIWFTCFWGMALLLHSLVPRANFHHCALLSISFLFTSYIQFWLSTFGHVIFSWPLLTYFLITKTLSLKIRLLGFSLSTLPLLGSLYPPSIIALCFCSIVLWLSTRPIKNSLKEAPYFAALSTIIILVWWITFEEYIHTILNTAYPGNRSNSGGAFSWESFVYIFSHFFPSIAFKGANTFTDRNICESATFGFSAVTCGIFFMKPTFFRDRFVQKCILALILMGAWIWTPVPASIGKILLWDKIPPNRMLSGFGPLYCILSAYILMRGEWSYKWIPAKLLIIGVIPIIFAPDKLHSYQRKEIWVPFLISIFISLLLFLKTLETKRLRFFAILFTCYTQLFLFFRFNPVQGTQDIFQDLSQTPAVREIRAELAQNNRKHLTSSFKTFGALLNGAGISAFSTTLLTPQLLVFRDIFPEMPYDQFNTVFNRYAHITVMDGLESPRVLYPDNVGIPSSALKKFGNYEADFIKN